jgi:isopenicillin-N epimerase
MADSSAAAPASEAPAAAGTGPAASSCSAPAPAPSAPATVVVRAKGYQAFGSFHSDNPEDMIRVPDDAYVPPPRPVECADLVSPPSPDAAGPPPYGRSALLSSAFFLDKSWTFVNHGAFGAACRPAMRAAQRWAEYAEEQPLRFIDRELFPLMCHSIRRVARDLLGGVPPCTVALVPNATYALTSAILSCPPLERGDAVFMLDIGYGSVKKMLTQACERAAGGGGGVDLVVGSVSFPVAGKEDLARKAVAAVPPNCRLAVVDHITSNTGILMPVEDIVSGIRARAPRAVVIVDGAHGLASQDLAPLLSLPDGDPRKPDIYISNAHKWLCSPKGLAVMYASPAVAARVRAAVISHGWGSGFTSEFMWDGARDYSAAVSLPTLLDWWEVRAGGLAAARAYCRQLLRDAVALLLAEFGQGTTTHVPAELYSHMACVELPASCLPPGAIRPDGSYACTSVHSKMLQDALHYAFRIECPVKTLPGPTGAGAPRSYLRISAMVYNDLDDFRTLARAVARIRWSEDGVLDPLPE